MCWKKDMTLASSLGAGGKFTAYATDLAGRDGCGVVRLEVGTDPRSGRAQGATHTRQLCVQRLLDLRDLRHALGRKRERGFDGVRFALDQLVAADLRARVQHGAAQEVG